MKTIEERIDQIVEGYAECRWLDASELRAYLEEIATEQKATDINKACEYLRNCKSWDYYNDEECDLMSEEDIEAFHKVMEE